MAKAVLISVAIPPPMLKTAANAAGTPMETFDQLRAASASRAARPLTGTYSSITSPQK